MTIHNFKAATLSELVPLTTYVFDNVLQNNLETLNDLLATIDVKECSSMVMVSLARSLYKIGHTIESYADFLESIVVQLHLINESTQSLRMFNLLKNYSGYNASVQGETIQDYIAIKNSL